MGSEELRKRQLGIKESLDGVTEGLKSGAAETERVINILDNTREILDNLDEEFCRLTKLNSTDVTFLFFATALQCLRQYLLTSDKFRFQNDKQADRAIKKYMPIDIAGPVPYDAIVKADGFSKNIGISGVNHRYTTLGHDPLLGWIFGTANILTDTLTKNNLIFESYNTQKAGNGYRIASPTTIINVFYDSIARVEANPTDLALAVVKQAVHLGSDAFTPMGLPMPAVGLIDQGLVKTLMKYNIDLYSAGRQVAIASFINMLIAAIHSLFYDPKEYENSRLYEVKTRKILSYSNLIASASNVIYVAVSVYLGNENAVKQLDVGGLIVTIYRLITDAKFIRQVKEEFIFGNYRELVMGEDER